MKLNKCVRLAKYGQSNYMKYSNVDNLRIKDL